MMYSSWPAKLHYIILARLQISTIVTVSVGTGSSSLYNTARKLLYLQLFSAINLTTSRSVMYIQSAVCPLKQCASLKPLLVKLRHPDISWHSCCSQPTAFCLKVTQVDKALMFS